MHRLRDELVIVNSGAQSDVVVGTIVTERYRPEEESYQEGNNSGESPLERAHSLKRWMTFYGSSSFTDSYSNRSTDEGFHGSLSKPRRAMLQQLLQRFHLESSFFQGGQSILLSTVEMMRVTDDVSITTIRSSASTLAPTNS